MIQPHPHSVKGQIKTAFNFSLCTHTLCPQSIDRRAMALIPSKTLIQGHALFLFLLAVYLTKSPEVVIESDLVFMLGELLRIVSSPYQNMKTNKRTIADSGNKTGCSTKPLPSPIALCTMRSAPRRRRSRRPNHHHESPSDQRDNRLS